MQVHGVAATGATPPMPRRQRTAAAAAASTAAAAGDEGIALLISALGVSPDHAAALLDHYGTADVVVRAQQDYENQVSAQRVQDFCELKFKDRRKAALSLLEHDADSVKRLLLDPLGTIRSMCSKGDSAVDRLVSLGYSREKAEIALKKANGDENEAAMTLLCNEI